MKLEDKLKTLPKTSGVYFHKDKNGEVIYIGKAAVLKNRVMQYFQKTRAQDTKTKALVVEIADVDWVETECEIDALFLEAEMIRRYMPKFNILLRDDKSLLYVRIDMKNQFPYVSFTRNPVDDNASYFGPYYNGFAIKKALRYLRKVFPYYTKMPGYHIGKYSENNRLDLDAHIGLSPINMTSLEYKNNLRKLVSYIKGDRKKIIADLNAEMKLNAKSHNFEKAAIIRNQINNLKELQKSIMFGDKEFLDISKDQALNDLKELLGLKKIPVRIEGYDISHMGGKDVVASMVVFKNGASDRAEYRKFKMRIDQNDDFKNMRETILRRLSDKNLKNWGTPDLILIDGGKGQLDAALQARNVLGKNKIVFIGLAKREEQIVVSQKLSNIHINPDKLKELNGYLEETDNFALINLLISSHITKLLQRIRNESHRFAVSYHTSIKRSKQVKSILDDIPGIGPKTRVKLIRKFGSIRAIKLASETEISEIVGQKVAKLVVSHITTQSS